MNETITETPVSIDQYGRIKSVRSDGYTVITHTDAVESERFFSRINALEKGKDELGLILFACISSVPNAVAKLKRDGRTEEQLRSDWITKVTSGGGLSTTEATQFLEGRIAAHHKQFPKARRWLGFDPFR